MEERDQALIESYLANELPPDEKSQVEKRAREDSKFGEMLTAYQTAVEALKIREKIFLKERLRARDKAFGHRIQLSSTGVYLRWTLAAASILLVVFIGWSYLIKGKLPHGGSGPAQLEQLYADNFSPYRQDMTEPASRGGEELTPLDQFNLDYWNEHYDKAVEDFKAIDTLLQKNEALQFRYANALLATGQFEESGLIFGDLFRLYHPPYGSESVWYIAMISLQRGDAKTARKALELYMRMPNVLHKKEAEKILHQLPGNEK